MDLVSLGVVALVLCFAGFCACFCVHCVGRIARSHQDAVAAVVDRCVTYRSAQSPEAHALSVMNGCLAEQSDRLMAFSEEGRDLLKHKETSREIIEGLRAQLAMQVKVLEQVGVRTRPDEVAPPPPPANPDLVEANFAERTRREL
jgi:hypothetical protein